MKHLHLVFILVILLVNNTEIFGQCGESAGADESICFNNLPLNLSTPVGTSWQGDFISSAGVFNPDVAGIYVVVLATSNGFCIDQDEKIITVLASPEVNAGSDQMVCEFESFQINATASSENGNIVVWSWSGDDEYLSSTNIPNPTANPVGSSSFNLTVADEAGCFSFDQINLTSAALPVVSAGNDIDICHTPAVITLSGTPAGGTWSGPGVSGSDFTSPGTGTHNLQYVYTDLMGCYNIDLKAISVDEVPEIVIQSDFSVCENEGDVTLQGYSPSNGLWEGEGIIAGTDVFSPEELEGVKTLTYSVGVETCYNESTVEVEVNEVPELVIPTEFNICHSETVVMLDNYSPTGGNWFGSIVHDSSIGNIDADIISSGNSISYAYEDPLTGCSKTGTSLVHIKELPSGSFELGALACLNTTLSLTNASSPELESQWFLNGDLTSTDDVPMISVSELGDHNLSLILIDEYACTKTLETQLVHVQDIPESNFLTDVTEGCEPMEVTFENLSQGDNMNFMWDFEVGNSISESPGTIIFGDINENTNYEISLEVSNECGSSIHSVSVLSKAEPTASFQTDISSICSPVHIDFLNMSSSSSSSFSWDLGDGDSSVEQDPLDKIYTTEAGLEEFIIELTATNECGSHSFQETILVFPNPVSSEITVSEIEACAPVDIQFVNSGIGATEFEYDFGDFSIFTEDAFSSFTVPGQYTVYQYATDGCGFDTTSVEVTIYPEPVSELSIDGNFCIGDQLVVSTEGENLVDYQWELSGNDAGVIDFIEIDLESSGSVGFSLSARTALNNCAVDLVQTIEVNPSPEIDFSLSAQEECSPYTLGIENYSSESLSYTWSLADFSETDSSPTFELTEEGSYSLNVMVTNDFGCVTEEFYQDVFFLNETPSVDFTFGPDDAHILTAPTISFQSLTDEVNTYYWKFGDGNSSFDQDPIHTYTDAGLFPVTLTASDEFGCSDEITLGVQVEDEFTVYVPNSFTPNGDGLNDVFRPIVKGDNFYDYKFSVFDRWGSILFQSNSPSDAWNGSVKSGNHYVSPGVYFWEITYILREGEGGRVNSGNVQVLR